MPHNRRGAVTQSGATLHLTMRDTQLGCNPPGRPLVGSNQDGVHYQPRIGEQVLVLGEQAGWTTTSVGAINPDPAAAKPPVMQPGTTTCFSQGTAVWSASGGTLTMSNAGFSGQLTLTGQTTASSATAGTATALPSAPAGYLSVSINNTVYKLPYYKP